jgi:hypothetical protein
MTSTGRDVVAPALKLVLVSARISGDAGPPSSPSWTLTAYTRCGKEADST